jgi:hypothetical protein
MSDVIKKAWSEGRTESAAHERAMASEYGRASRPPVKGLWTATIKKFTEGPYKDVRPQPSTAALKPRSPE